MLSFTADWTNITVVDATQVEIECEYERGDPNWIPSDESEEKQADENQPNQQAIISQIKYMRISQTKQKRISQINRRSSQIKQRKISQS